MGKSSPPPPPEPPSPAEIAAANIETAEHIQRLQRAMEFGEEMLRREVDDAGNVTRYERVKTDAPTGSEPVYDTEMIQISGPEVLLVGERGEHQNVVRFDKMGVLRRA